MMRGRKHVTGMLAAVSVIGILTAGNVMADDDAKKANYGQLKLGVFQPTDDLDDADFDTTAEFGAAYGRYLSPYLVVEAAVVGFGLENDIHGQNASAGSFKREDSLAVGAFLATIKGELPAGPVSLYGGIGGGVYSVSFESDIESSRLGDFSSDDDDDVVLGAHVVVGGNYDITNRFFVGLEGMYRWTDDLDLGETVASIPVEYDGDLTGFTVTVNAGLRF